MGRQVSFWLLLLMLAVLLQGCESGFDKCMATELPRAYESLGIAGGELHFDEQGLIDLMHKKRRRLDEMLANVQPERVDRLDSEETSLLFKKISEATGRDVASVGGAIASINLALDELPDDTVLAIKGLREFQDQGTDIATRACNRNGIYK